MKIIESIKKFWKDLGVTYSKENPVPRAYLRRGTMEQISKAKPNYVGELVLCTNAAFLYVGETLAPGGFLPIALTTRVRGPFLSHYNHSNRESPDLNWPDHAYLDTSKIDLTLFR